MCDNDFFHHKFSSMCQIYGQKHDNCKVNESIQIQFLSKSKIKFWDDQKDFVSHRDVGTVSVDRILRLIVISLIFSLDYVCYTCFMDFDIHYLCTNIN